MKKLASIVLSVLLIVSLSACSAGGAAPSESSGGNTSTDSKSSAQESTVTLTGEITGKITVTTYDTFRSKSYLDNAAKLFEEKYPGTKINVESFSAMPEIKTSEQGGMTMSAITMEDDPQGRQDYINKINTSLMSGKGADILAIDVLPVHKYIDGGQLENLNAYMNADPEFSRADYRSNILVAIEYNGGTWFLPMDYSFNYYAYDSTLLSDDAALSFGTGSAFTAEELISLATPAFDGSNKLFNSDDYRMYNDLLTESYRSIVDIENKTAHFSDGGYAELLDTVKQYASDGYIAEGVRGQEDAGMIMSKMTEAPSERFFYKLNNATMLMNTYTKNLSNMRTNMVSFGGMFANEDDDEIAGIQANADGSIPFTFDQAFGINSNSQNKETAWAFIKFLLSEEIQLNNSMSMAFPLLNSAREKQAKNRLTGNLAIGNGIALATSANVSPENEEQPLTDEQKEALAEYNKALENLSDQINTYVFKDTIVDDTISSEAEYFFDGSKTAAEVTSTLQSKIDLYLSE